MDARRMSPEQRVAAVLDLMRPMVRHYDGAVWCATQDDIAKWVEILAGQRPRTYCMGYPRTECRVCGSVVWDVYYLPPPEKGLCQMCCPHKLPDRDNRGDCRVCGDRPTSAQPTTKGTP